MEFENEKFSNPSDVSQDAKERQIKESEFGKDKMYLYSFHKRNGFYMDENNRYHADEFPTDVESLSYYSDKDSVDDYDELNSDVQNIKNRILSKALFNKDEDIEDLLLPLKNKYPDVDFSNYDLVLESRLVPEDKYGALGVLDASPISASSHLDSKGNLKSIGDRHIHFINILFKDQKGEPGLAITLAALPNINNPKVAVQT